MTKMATLINGARVPLFMVAQTLTHLHQLGNAEGVMAIYELVEVCKNPSHRPFGKTGERMHCYALLTEWDAATGRAKVHDIVRDIVLAAVQGEDLDLAIVDNIVVSTEEVND